MKIVIIGNGISGTTCARFIRKQSDHEITIVSSETEFFYSRTALMYIYMGHMRYEDTKPYEDWFWSKNRISILKDHVDHIDFKAKSLKLGSGNELGYDKLVLALGSKSNKFGWPGQDLNGVGGLYHIQDLHKMENFSDSLKRAVIVGGGLIGIEMAEMFHSRHIPVTMLVREDQYWNNVLPSEEAELISQHIKNHHIDLRLGANLEKIHDDGNGSACAVTIKETGEKIDCGFVGLTAGVSPNIDFLKSSELETGRGIKVNKHLETNIADVYAIGDCAELIEPNKERRSIEAVWYTGRMMGETAAYNICGKPIEYDPGIWFNSAKFMDIEYQVYGQVPNLDSENHDSLVWTHPDGTKLIRIVFNSADQTVIGFNLLGVRYRQEVCLKWIEEKAPLETVLSQLSLANFDPEFYQSYESEIRQLYQQRFGKEIKNTRSRKLDQVIKFLSLK